MATEALETTSVAEEAITPTETPGAPAEPAAAPATDGESESGKASAAERARDERGRFAKGQAESVAAEAAAPVAEPPVPATEPVPVPAPQPVTTEPFTFRGAGQRHQFPESSVSPEGDVTIKAAAVPQLRQLLADAADHRLNWKTKTSDYEKQIQEAGAVGEAKAQKYNNAAILLWEVISDPNKVRALAENPERVELLKERLDLLLQSHDLKVPKAPERQAPEVTEQQVEQAARSTLNEYLDELMESPQARAIYDTPEKREAVKKSYQRRLQAYFVEKDGEVFLSEAVVDEDWKEGVEARAALQKDQQEQARKLAEAAAKNAPPAPAKVPNVVPAKGSPTPSDAPKVRDRAAWAREHGMA